MVLRAIVGVGLCAQLSFAAHGKSDIGRESLQTCDAALTEEDGLGRASLRIGDAALTSASMLETSQGGKSLAEVSPLKTLGVVSGIGMLHGASGFAPRSATTRSATARIDGASVALNAGTTDDGRHKEPDPWQIMHRRWRQRVGDGEKDMNSYHPTISKLFSIPGGLHMLGSAYVAGKVAEILGGPDAYQSEQFRLGLQYFMRVNGILPHVNFRPIDEATRKSLVDIYGEKGKTLSAEDIQSAPFYVANHASFLDGFLLYEALRSPKVIAKAEVRDIPVLGNILENAGVIYVDREDKKSRGATAMKLMRHLKDWKVGEDRPLLIFPEGTTANGQKLAPFNPGVFGVSVKVLDSNGSPVLDAEGKPKRRLAPVRIVLIVYTGDDGDIASPPYRKTPQGVQDYTSLEWAEEFFGHFVHSVHIEVLPPRFPSDAENKDPRLYMKNVQDEMQAELNLLRQKLGLPYES